jgi:hypothetical protein
VSAPIFISYSSKDKDIAETIYQALEARGLDCWIACRNVNPGENFQEAIVRALRAAKVMLLVFTSNANNSDEIKKELVLAGRHHVTVVPVRASRMWCPTTPSLTNSPPGNGSTCSGIGSKRLNCSHRGSNTLWRTPSRTGQRPARLSPHRGGFRKNRRTCR